MRRTNGLRFGGWLVLLVLLFVARGAGATSGGDKLVAPASMWAYMPLVAAAAPADLDVALTVKENADVGAAAFPISAVIPLARGAYTDTAALGIAGTPSQVQALERWPDGSLRHVQVHFQASVASGGSSVYHFTASGQTAPPVPVTVTETAGDVTVVTGPLRFIVNKSAFNILDQLWLDANGDGSFAAGEQLIAAHAQNGGVFVPRAGAGATQYDAARSGVQITVEERGPMRVVIRAEAPARFTSTTDHTHGFAVRIYAYAGQPFVQVDYQLQNSDRTVVRSWPLYFEALALDLRLALAGPTTLRFGQGDGAVFSTANSGGAYLAQEAHNTFKIRNLATDALLYDAGTLPSGRGPEGFVDVSTADRGVLAAVRNFWQTWPNGLTVDAANRLSLQLFPPWSAQWHNKQLSPSGLYWLEDMQHVLKETLFYFHGPDAPDTELIGLARTFQYPPLASVSLDWHRQTAATLDLGGVIPPAATIPAAADERRPVYGTVGADPADWYNPAADYYGAGWVNFYDPEPGYRTGACTPGGWPYDSGRPIATGAPAALFTVKGWALAELNLRPQWLTGYNHAADWPTLRLTENPYCDGRWRIFEGHGIPTLAAPPLPGTGGEYPVYFARDDQHGWFYHVADAYWLTGDPWIRDWYGFVAQFRRARLGRLDPFPDTSSRATGHSLSHTLQAYRVSGDAALLTELGAHIRTYLRPDQDPLYGDQRPSVEALGGSFQTGYLMRFVVNYLEEVRAAGDAQAYAEAFNYLAGLVEWNYHYGNFPYYFDARAGGVGVSNGTSLTLVDPQAWYYWHTGQRRYLDQIDAYVTTGIGTGGETPYGEFSEWRGQFEGRTYLYVKNMPRPDSAPPPAIGDLAAVTGDGATTLTWTAPAGAARYHVLWSDKPIVAHSTDPGVTNWWAANVVGPSLTPAPGARQALTITTGAISPVYAAILTFDAADNLSDLSNVALASSTYYIRSDGGSTVECTGLADTPYGGSGTGQPCAWDHPFRALPPGGAPRIAGGDTLLIGAGSYMLGYGAPETDACDPDGAFDCTMPPIPSGAGPTQRTRILGAGWETGCAAPPELWGAERPWFLLNLTDASHVELGCLEVTDHSPCVEHHLHGLGGSPLACERDSAPYGSWAPVGLYAEDSTDVTLHDLNIHGLASTGIHAGRLTDWTVEDVRITGNGLAGWDGDIDGDDGNAGVLAFRRWTVAWNGCGETYPGGQPAGCWSQTAGGYGDGVGTGETGGHWIVEDSEFLYNTSDGLDLLYVRRPGSQIELRRVHAEGNAGNQIKTNGPTMIENAVIVGNCGYFDGQPFTADVDNCRAVGNAASLSLQPGDVVTLTNNTLTGEGDCLVLAACEGVCGGSERVYLRNNLFQGQTDFLQTWEPTCLVYAQDFPADPFDFDTSLITGVKHDACPGAYAICGGSAGLVNTGVDTFNPHLLAASRAVNAGAAGAPTDDIENQPRDALPDIGADEYALAVTPAPLAINKQNNDVLLAWPADPANSGGYEVWWSASPYFLPGADGSDHVALPAGSSGYRHTGAPGDAIFYIVLGVNGAAEKSAASELVGRWRQALIAGE